MIFCQKAYSSLLLGPLFLLLTSSSILGQDLVINELMAINNECCTDPSGAHVDWVEIYNPSSQTIDVDRWYLSDSFSNTTKWRFPHDEPQLTRIPAGGYMIVYLDGRLVQDELHASFSLDGDKDEIALYREDGTTVVDSVSFRDQKTDISYGRHPNGSGSFAFLTEATPGQSNKSPYGDGFADPPSIQPASSIRNSPLSVTIQNNGGGDIHYTTDGSEPTKSKPRYNGPISVSQSTVVRARVYRDGMGPSEVVSHSYLINIESTHLPILSIMADPFDLYDYNTGILVEGPGQPGCSQECENYYQDWKRRTEVAYFDKNKSLRFSNSGTIRVAGRTSRTNPKKSFVIDTDKKIRFALFDQHPDEDRYDGFWVRAGDPVGLPNEIFDVLNRQSGSRMDAQAWKHALVYLNGEYHGIFNLMERKNPAYVDRHYGAKDLDMWDSHDQVKEGDALWMNEALDFFFTSEYSGSNGFEKAGKYFDMDSVIEYYLTNVILTRTDVVNTRIWRERPDGAFRVLTYDYDRFRDGRNVLEFFTAQNQPRFFYLILPTLLKNAEFKARFVNRAADLLNGPYSVENHLRVIEELAEYIEPEIMRELQFWGPEQYIFIPDRGIENWRENLDDRRQFARNQTDAVRNQIRQGLGLSGEAEIELKVEGEGDIRFSTVDVREFPWTARYFKSVKIPVTASARPGWRFQRWEGLSNRTDENIEVQLSNNSSLTAVFVRDNQCQDVQLDLVITEINYHPGSGSADSGDWFEVYNKGNQALDLRNWTVVDDDTTVKFSGSPQVSAGQYFVFVEDEDLFKAAHPGVSSYALVPGLKLSNGGERVEIANTASCTIDEVAYEDEFPWPVSADGTGYTLALSDAAADNGNVKFWGRSLDIGGTPGKENRVFLETTSEETVVEPLTPGLGPVYPHPVASHSEFTFVPRNAGTASIDLYDATGRLVRTLFTGKAAMGAATMIDIDGVDLSPGAYFVRLSDDEGYLVRPLIVTR